MAAALFDVVANGKVKIKINQRYALEDAAEAHADLEAPQDDRHDRADSVSVQLNFLKIFQGRRALRCRRDAYDAPGT